MSCAPPPLTQGDLPSPTDSRFFSRLLSSDDLGDVLDADEYLRPDKELEEQRCQQEQQHTRHMVSSCSRPLRLRPLRPRPPLTSTSLWFPPERASGPGEQRGSALHLRPHQQQPAGDGGLQPRYTLAVLAVL